MKKTLFAMAFGLAVPMASFAEDFATKADAQGMVSKAVKAISTNKEATLKEITGKDAKWVNKDLYPMVYNMNGVCLAHGQNPKHVGKDMIELADADGKEFVKERVELAKSKGKFWQDYRYTDPVTRKILPKQLYCEKTGEMIVCAGIYKR